MKYFYISIFLFVFFCKNSHAQKYQPYDTNMVWKVFHTGSATAFSNQCYRTDAYNYYVRNYIVNNGRLWHKVYANVLQGNFIHQSFGGNCDPSIVPVNSTQFIGMFTNDTLNKKVYFVPTWSLAPNFTPTNANLIFDSNKTTGDIMTVFSGADPSTPVLNYQIHTIDSVLLGTKYHKRLIGTTTNTMNYSPNTAYFIEGVGSSGGVFNSSFNIFTYKSSKLACFSNINYTKYYSGQYTWNIAIQNSPGALRDTTTCFTSLPSGITKNNLSDQNIKIYPNPVKDKLTIDVENKNTEDINFSLTNSLGQLIDINSKIANTKLEIDTSELPSGVYYLKIQNNSGQEEFKIIKE
jgi:hypothetical protein